MLKEHIEANKLIDLAHTGDREAYKARLAELQKKYPPAVYESITRNAARQYKSEVNDHRYVGWRADWINERKGEGESNG